MSANWVVRAATKRSACVKMALVRVLMDLTSSSLSADLGICSNSARRLFNVTSGAAPWGAAVCAPAALLSTMATRKAAMQRITQLIVRIIGRHVARWPASVKPDQAASDIGRGRISLDHQRECQCRRHLPELPVAIVNRLP